MTVGFAVRRHNVSPRWERVVASTRVSIEAGADMPKLHVTQDDYGYWMLSLEQDDGSMTLLAHQFVAPEKLIEIANELIAEKKVSATIVIDPPGARGPALEAAPGDYKKPEPRKAGA